MSKRNRRELIARGKRIRQIRKERLKRELEELNNVKKSSKTSRIFNILFIFAVLIGLIIYMINVDGIDNMREVLTNANYLWILGGLICLILEWLFEAIVMQIPLKRMYPKHKLSTSFKSNIIGKLFNNITPFSSGGQPFQAYILSKNGLRASDTFSVLMMKFVVYQISIFSWALLLLTINFNFFNETFKDFIGIVILGFVLNLIATLFIFIAGLNKNIILKIARPIIKLGAKIKIGKHVIIKDLEATLNKIDGSISNYSSQFNEMKNQKIALIKMYVFCMLQLLAYFSIPFMIYKAFGNVGISYIEIITVQTYLLLIISFIPTPGSGLGAEGGFALLYKDVFITGLHMAILFWRIYTFYLPILAGLAVLILMTRQEKSVES